MNGNEAKVDAVTDEQLSDNQALLDMAQLFEAMATNANPHPLAFAQICKRLHAQLPDLSAAALQSPTSQEEGK